MKIDMGMEYNYGQMELNTRVSGKTIKLMGRGYFTTWMETFSRVIGRTTKQTDMGFISTQMELVTRATGTMICSMVTVLRLGLMVLNMKVTTSRGKSREMVLTPGQTEQFTQVNGLTTLLMDLESTPGAMVEPMKENGKTTR